MSVLSTEALRNNAIYVYNSLLFESDLNLNEDKIYQAKNQSGYVSGLENGEKLSTAVEIWRYVVEEILHYDFETAVAYLDPHLVSILKLDQTVEWFGGGDKDRTRPDYAFVLQFLYPEKTKFIEDKHVRDMCEYAHKNKSVLSKSLFWSQNYYNEQVEEHRKKAQKENRKYNDAYSQKQVYRGRENAIICMRQIIYGHLFGNSTSREMYDLFADEEKAKKLINSYGRFYKSVIPQYFPTALDYFHEALYKKDRNALWYEMLKIRRNYDRVARKANFMGEL